MRAATPVAIRNVVPAGPARGRLAPSRLTGAPGTVATEVASPTALGGGVRGITASFAASAVVVVTRTTSRGGGLAGVPASGPGRPTGHGIAVAAA